MELIIKILVFVKDSFLHIWPYLLITIPLAVAVQLSGVSKFITRIIGLNPVISILLATLIGAFSPFCSCGVIPLIGTLLIAGVPLAPVMSFWIASPSMDPEIFFLGASVIGIKMSVWRLIATFTISLGAGLFTHLAVKTGWLNSDDVLIMEKHEKSKPSKFSRERLILNLKELFPLPKLIQLLSSKSIVDDSEVIYNCCVRADEPNYIDNRLQSSNHESKTSCCLEKVITLPPGKRFFSETWKALYMTVKFMALAFLVNALIVFCLPSHLFNGVLANNGPFSVVIAALVGIPLYTSNITALPLVSGMMAAGMNPGAALAFLIAGPVTTLPAMSAVWGMVSRKVFALYLIIPFAGAVLFGWLYTIFRY